MLINLGIRNGHFHKLPGNRQSGYRAIETVLHLLNIPAVDITVPDAIPVGVVGWSIYGGQGIVKVDQSVTAKIATVSPFGQVGSWKTLTVSLVTRPMVLVGREASSGEGGNELAARLLRARAPSLKKSFREIRLAMGMILINPWQISKDVYTTEVEDFLMAHLKKSTGGPYLW
jgi:hypothetical protein